jgi:hypothetical protein
MPDQMPEGISTGMSNDMPVAIENNERRESEEEEAYVEQAASPPAQKAEQRRKTFSPYTMPPKNRSPLYGKVPNQIKALAPNPGVPRVRGPVDIVTGGMGMPKKTTGAVTKKLAVASPMEMVLGRKKKPVQPEE